MARYHFSSGRPSPLSYRCHNSLCLVPGEWLRPEDKDGNSRLGGEFRFSYFQMEKPEENVYARAISLLVHLLCILKCENIFKSATSNERH